MRPLRLILFSCSCFFLFVCMIYISLSNDDLNTDPKEPQNRRDYGSFPFLRNPASIFTPSATISLTDDNSTFFAARPAAFGPLLPDRGLSGQIWIGSGFGDNTVASRKVKSAGEGELGCSDIPGWLDFEWRVKTDDEDFEAPALRRAEPLLEVDEISEATDDHFYPVTNAVTSRSTEVVGRSFEEEAAAIDQKIVLLSRGGCGFSEKVNWAQRRGAVAVIVGDNLRGGPLVRMSAHGDSSNITIPSLFTSHTTAHLLSSLMPAGLGANVRRTDMDDDDEDNDETNNGGHHFWDDDPDTYNFREGLWVTLSPTDMSASPFFNTLFVLVISPLVTLAIVYSMLLLRSRIRRRRWRAPKSVVERLPVHIYHALSRSSSRTEELQPQAAAPTVNTPLLASSQPTDIVRPDGIQPETGVGASLPSSSQYGSLETSAATEREKNEAGLAEWKRKYKGRQSECVICLEEYVDGVSEVMSLPCGHEFHRDCITPWLVTRRRTCPICKGDVVRQLGRVNRPTSTANDMTEEEIQAQAAETINDSDAASRPLTPVDMPVRTDDDVDLERGNVPTTSLASEEPRESSWFRRGLGYFGVRHGSHDETRPASSTTHE